MQAEDCSFLRPHLGEKQTRVPSSSGACLKATRAGASRPQRVEPAADAQTSGERKTCSSKAPQAVAILFLKNTFIKQEISSLYHSIVFLFLCIVHLRRLSHLSLPFSETLHSAEYVYSCDSVLKSRDITLPTKVPIVKAMVIPIVLYDCENWTIKKMDH